MIILTLVLTKDIMHLRETGRRRPSTEDKSWEENGGGVKGNIPLKRIGEPRHYRQGRCSTPHLKSTDRHCEWSWL